MCARQFGGTLDSAHCDFSMIKEVVPGICKFHTTGMSIEQRCAELVFQITDSSAYGRLVNSDHTRCTAKTLVLCRRDYVSKVTQFYARLHSPKEPKSVVESR